MNYKEAGAVQWLSTIKSMIFYLTLTFMYVGVEAIQKLCRQQYISK